MFSDGMPIAIDLAASVTAAGSMKPPIQPSALPTSSAARPTGKFPGSRTPAMKPAMMIMKTGRAIHSAPHICAPGRIEMNVSEMPASVPSIAARGVQWRIVGPTKAPMRMMMPMMKAHASPAVQAAIGSLVARYVGSMITSVTMNMCGTLGPYGIAVTSSRPLLDRQLAGEVEVEEVADQQLDAERRQDDLVDVVGRHVHHADAQPGEHQAR